jgi:hypothetical protein
MGRANEKVKTGRLKRESGMQWLKPRCIALSSDR